MDTLKELNMDERSYVSCIKINGVPILPPMMTKDIKEEMTYYKERAVALEKRLATARDIQPNPTCIEIIRKGPKDRRFTEKALSLNNIATYSNSKTIIFDDFPSVTTIAGTRTTATKLKLRKDHLPIDDPSLQLKENQTRNLNLDAEDDSNNRASPIPKAIPKVESSTPELISLNNCSNEIVLPKSITNEGPASETRKPQVPKTLNIVPLTLNNNSICRSDIKYRGSDSENSSDTPKLVRQGSYILDTPSPQLLAHMHTELINSEYVPTPTTMTNTARRKEWNIAQAKIEWERQCKTKEIGVTNYDTSNDSSRHVRGCPSNSERGIRKSFSLQAKPRVPLGSYVPTRSVDCIQAMLAKEYIGRSNGKSHYDQHYSGKADDDDDAEKNDRLEDWSESSSRSLSILNLAEKLGGSLGNLNNVSVTPLSKHTDNGDKEQVSISNGFEKGITRSNETRDSTSKLKSFVTSDKLLIVYKEIQEMHKKQMTELVSRQQREQTLLQKEFEKQQLVLLTEIKRSFPEISVSLTSENVSSPALDKLLSENTRLSANVGVCTPNGGIANNVQRAYETQYQREDRTRTIPSTCPLDYINSEMNLRSPSQCAVKSSRSTQTLRGESPTGVKNVSATDENESWVISGNVMNGDKLIASCERKRLSVSRELFPLDSKTTHVPVLGNTGYEAKHIRAASVINAYARGYLVRRMMQTERVIALKNTYKEALHCMLKLHVDAPLNRSEFNFLHRLQLQCDAASMNMAELFSQSPMKRMQVIAQDREIKRSRTERPTSARLYSFATQRTLARKKLMKEMGDYQLPSLSRSYSARSRCQTWTSDVKEKLIPPNVLHESIKRSTSAGTVRKPWR